MHIVDWVVIAAYFAPVLGVAWWAADRDRSAKARQAS